MPVAPVAPVVIARDGGPAAEIQVLRLAGGPGAGEPPLPPMVQWRSATFAPRGPGAVRPLPAQTIEGVRADGERTTWTIEAGRIGNERPIEIVREVWTSPELMLTVATREFDPRAGEVNYRLKNLRRGEPDAALMRVPPDFTTPGRPAGAASGATPEAVPRR
jgi:hypothetical protein